MRRIAFGCRRIIARTLFRRPGIRARLAAMPESLPLDAARELEFKIGGKRSFTRI